MRRRRALNWNSFWPNGAQTYLSLFFSLLQLFLFIQMNGCYVGHDWIPARIWMNENGNVLRSNCTHIFFPCRCIIQIRFIERALHAHYIYISYVIIRNNIWNLNDRDEMFEYMGIDICMAMWKQSIHFFFFRICLLNSNKVGNSHMASLAFAVAISINPIRIPVQFSVLCAIYIYGSPFRLLWREKNNRMPSCHVIIIWTTVLTVFVDHKSL